MMNKYAIFASIIGVAWLLSSSDHCSHSVIETEILEEVLDQLKGDVCTQISDLTDKIDSLENKKI